MKPKVIAFVPIRSGSKSIFNKNIKSFCGKPLVYWIAKALNDAPNVDEIYIGTDEIEPYMNIIRNFNLNKVNLYLRDAENSRDESTTEDVMLEFLKYHINGYNGDDIFMIVQATSPMTTSIQFDSAIEQYKREENESMLSCVRFKRFLWKKNGVPFNYDFTKRPLRQEWDGSFLENGSFYINRITNILRDECRLTNPVGIYILPEWHLYEIDEPEDWPVMEKIFRKHILIGE